MSCYFRKMDMNTRLELSKMTEFMSSNWQQLQYNREEMQYYMEKMQCILNKVVQECCLVQGVHREDSTGLYRDELLVDELTRSATDVDEDELKNYAKEDVIVVEMNGVFDNVDFIGGEECLVDEFNVYDEVEDHGVVDEKICDVDFSEYDPFWIAICDDASEAGEHLRLKNLVFMCEHVLFLDPTILRHSKLFKLGGCVIVKQTMVRDYDGFNGLGVFQISLALIRDYDGFNGPGYLEVKVVKRGGYCYVQNCMRTILVTCKTIGSLVVLDLGLYR